MRHTKVSVYIQFLLQVDRKLSLDDLCVGYNFNVRRKELPGTGRPTRSRGSARIDKTKKKKRHGATDKGVNSLLKKYLSLSAVLVPWVYGVVCLRRVTKKKASPIEEYMYIIKYNITYNPVGFLSTQHLYYNNTLLSGGT